MRSKSTAKLKQMKDIVTSKHDRDTLSRLKVSLKHICAELPNVSHLVAFDITVLAKNSFPFDNLTPTCSNKMFS
jgi:hypothetical protein